MKKPLLLLFAFMITAPLCADTLANYMSIEKKIPTMQLKADMSAHAWARSARKILVLHDEALSESIHEMNTLAKKNGHPLFCLPSETAISPENIHKILLKEASRIPEDKQKNVSVAKVAMEAIIRQIGWELGQYGITANAVQAGVTPTRALTKITEGWETWIENTKKRNPMRRTTTPEDVAGTISMLLKPEADFINCSIIYCDGGESRSGSF